MSANNLLHDDYKFIASMVRENSGIVLDEGKEYLVETRLRPVLRLRGLPDFGSLVDELRSGTDRTARQAVIEALTTNETHFFRDEVFYAGLRDSVLPYLVEERRATQKLTLWCAACSSGQEPYSVLMMIHEHFPELLSWDFRFIVSDLSEHMLQRTRDGIYAQHEVNRGLPASLLTKHFVRNGLEWQVAEHLRRFLDVRLVNLTKPWGDMPTIDLLLIRNVLIYFDLTTKQTILDRCKATLAPDGFLFLGAAETTINMDVGLVRERDFRANCYRLECT